MKSQPLLVPVPVAAAPGVDETPSKLSVEHAAPAKTWWGRIPLIHGDDRGRPGLLLQVLAIAIFLIAYDGLRNLAPVRGDAAFANAGRVLRFERALRISPEHGLNSWVSAHHTLALVASTFYDSAHYLVTFPLLCFVYLRVPGAYRRLRDAIFATNAIGLLGFWLFPLAPPRMLAGFVDTVAQTHALGGWSSTISKNADEYAAMPSLHVAWALWVALTVYTITRTAGKWKRPLRAVACLDVAFTVFVILSTANHYVVDALAGGACLLLAVGGVHTARLAAGWWVRRQLEGPARTERARYV